MSHFAKIENKIVTQVIVAEQDFVDMMNGQWVQTSYNTRSGIHYAPNSYESDGGVALRKNYAGIGYTYDSDRDAFIPQKPYNSWLLDEPTCTWEAPVPQPEGNYIWNEETQSWNL
jgi:hypothetical protein|tara:strand:+ start:227 stop:571 length:345 start_codon:yes stop_codon:yes gene_type:complete